MEKIKLENDIKVFGKEVEHFPNGVDTAFHDMIKKINDENELYRSYYGISECKNAKIYYYAVAEQKHDDEAGKLGYESYTIEKGDYYFEPLKNWRTKTDCIKDIFMKMMESDAVNKQKPAVEWYKNDEEMFCMMKAIN